MLIVDTPSPVILLDLIKYDTPHLGPRIQLMLSQLEFKLSVEKQYKEGIEKMAKLYQIEGDRRSRQDAESKRIESNQKIQLLKQALKRYEDLHVDMDMGSDEADGGFFSHHPFISCGYIAHASASRVDPLARR